MQENRIILSISSDIGFELAKVWHKRGHNVYGTYRNYSDKCKLLSSMGVKLFHCDLNKTYTIKNVIKKINKEFKWDVVVLAAGNQEPVSSFIECKFEEWESSIISNFTAQLRFLHGILKNRNNDYKKIPKVLFFAGGGTNNATLNYSAYTISKIASIKICELLDAEIHDTSFSILGPGWVKTKIHKATFKAKNKAGDNYTRTKKIFKNKDFFPMSEVINCCDWVLSSSKELVGGRNFSAVFDPWKSDKINLINNDINNFKLRRFGNHLFDD